MLFTYFNFFMCLFAVYVCVKACDYILRLNSCHRPWQLVPLAADPSHPALKVQMVSFDPNSSLLGLPNLP